MTAFRQSYLLAALAALLPFSRELSAAHIPQNVETFFVTPDKEASLALKADADRPVNFSIADTWGKAVLSASVTPENGRLVLNVNLPAGFYSLTLPESRESFGIVSAPAFEGAPDRYFSIDSAMAWLVPSADLRAGIIAGFRRNGIAMSRERLSWRGVNPAEGQWDWVTKSRYDELAQQYARTGVPVLQMFHDSPDYPGLAGKFPQDLVKTYDAWRVILNRNEKLWAAMEVWNEPDIGFGGYSPADQMMPLLLTHAYLCQENGFTLPLGGGVMAALNKEYFTCAADNGMLASSDFFSYHCYTRALSVENQVAALREWMADYAQSAKPIWITESGLPWKRGPMRPPIQEDAVSAMEIVAKAIEFRACGVERYFPFVAPYYEEKSANFGMIGKEGTPLRSMAGYVTVVRLLAQARYLGDIPDLAADIKRARVFGRDDQVIVALYTARADANATVDCNLTAKEILGIDGRRLARTADGKIPVPDGVTYVVTDRASLGMRVKSDTPAMRLYRMARQAAPVRAKIAPVIPQFVLQQGAASASAECYMVPPEMTGQFPLRVRLTNLDASQSKTVRLRPYLRDVPLAEPVRVELAPRSVGEANFTLNLRSAFGGSDRASLRLVADEKGIMQPLVLPVATEKTLDDWKTYFGRAERLPLAKLDEWSGNSVQGSKEQFTSPAENLWRFDVNFPKNADAWAYPKYTLPETIRMKNAAGLLLRIRCEKPATVRLFAWETQSIGYMTVNGIIPVDNRWHTVFVPFERFTASPLQEPDPNGQLDRDDVRVLSIGFNSREQVNSLEVSDCFVVWTIEK